MNSTGIVRKVDELGRIVLPIELRRRMGIAEKDLLVIGVDGPSIILSRADPNSPGIARKVDELGRIVLPIELRRKLDIPEKCPLEIFVDEQYIILKKYQPACIFCDNARDVISFKGKNICPGCLKELKAQ